MNLKLKPTAMQVEAIEFCLNNPYSILALHMGLGKSLCAIAIKDRIKNSRCLVICPAYLIFNWKKEIEKSLDNQIITVFDKGSKVYHPVDSDFVIISYDLAMKSPFLFEWATMVVLDEATAVKNMDAKRSEAIHKYVYESSVPRLHLLTGTPIKNRVTEFYSLMCLCFYNPKIAEAPFLKEFTTQVDFSNHFSYLQEFTMERGYRYFTVQKWEGLRNESELKRYLKDIYFHRKSDLKPIRYLDVQLESFDDEELREAFDNYEDGVSSVAPQVKAKAALRKAPLTVAYIKGLQDRAEVEGPIVVFTDHVGSCELIAKAFNIRPIHGGIPPNIRQQMANDFQEGKIPVLVATFGSFSTGYTLTRSNFMVWNDFPWVPGDLEQAAFRINRLGQTRPCTVVRLFGSEQDAYIFETITAKDEVLRRFF